MAEILIFASVLAGIVVGFVEVIKRATNVSAKYLPLVAVVVGALVGFASAPFSDLDLTLRLWAGALAGLSGTGLFELTTNREKEGR